MPDFTRHQTVPAQRRRDLTDIPPMPRTPLETRQGTQPAAWSHRRVTGLRLTLAGVVVAVALLVAALAWRPLTTPLHSGGSPLLAHSLWTNTPEIESGR